MEELMKILEELRPDVDFASEDALVTGGVLDSFDIVGMVAELNNAFDIEIGPSDLIPENFNTAAAIWALVEQLQED